MEAQVIHEKLVARFGEQVLSADLEAASPFVVVAAGVIPEVAAFCKEDPDLAFDAGEFSGERRDVFARSQVPQFLLKPRQIPVAMGNLRSHAPAIHRR